ncbi:hypothetical protein WH52_00700 [Tenacibaculum holothuriorum]|uniref:Outer membrane protein beta-barrel domain-containing protein n=1 Tax=Tenacibaculum holothuriorum TaxID=1635173 RepID=A0A1Y2PFD5_9FLAO|nr:outer membrane beta-barrel protein [Tenacibaculum holothuriorum]OSY89206.1 hypothetical protein WH52_00700 [Tenacibaculum holothuriorum]
MKKLILVLCLFLGATQLSQAQLHFGIKGGINYNSDSFTAVKDDVLSGAKSKTGFHAGIWLRGKIPFLGLYIRPELVYTQLSNEVTYLPKGTTTSKTTSYDFKKIDIPVLFGKKFLGIAHIYAGPSFQYVLGSDFSLSDLKEIDSDGFSMGIQFGGGIELGKIGLDLRWERAFSNTEAKFLDGNNPVTFDTRVNQIIVGLTYRF